MTKKMEQLVKRIEALPVETQDAFAAQWQQDVDGGNEMTQAWRDELDRRLDEHERNPSDVIPWEVAEKRLRARFG